MNVSLTPELEKLVHRKVRSGLYHSASEVVREALRMLEERDRVNFLKLEELRKAIRVGLDEADRGELLEGPAELEKLRRKLRASRSGGKAR